MFNITPEEGVFGGWSTFPCDHCNPASMLSLPKWFTRLPVNNRNSSPDQTNPFRKKKSH